MINREQYNLLQHKRATKLKGMKREIQIVGIHLYRGINNTPHHEQATSALYRGLYMYTHPRRKIFAPNEQEQRRRGIFLYGKALSLLPNQENPLLFTVPSPPPSSARVDFLRVFSIRVALLLLQHLPRVCSRVYRNSQFAREHSPSYSR